MKKRNLVYSTDQGRTCPECEQAIDDCQCNQSSILGDGKVRITLETKGRKGKGVTLVSGLAMTLDEMKQLAKKLKAQCGTGGAVKDNQIEIQGDNREKIKDLLQKQGISAKISGG
ncbi:stress response translation initiation inhibitor YciH [Marinomonas sp.]